MTIPIDPVSDLLPTVAIPLPTKVYDTVVKRHVDIKLQCPGVTSDAAKHIFLATFDEVQRIIACPTCNASTDVPVEYRGQP